MSGPDIEARARVIQEQNQLVQQLRDSGNDKAAYRLQETYHAREMSGLASDVYLSANKQGSPPDGWTRASSDPAALRAAGLNISDSDLKELLEPRDSGFRAEIYLPDKAVFGESAKPVIVYKGSTGEIVDPSAPGGRRESGGEDFLNNGQQGIGMRSDYYDRAMRLATVVNKAVPGGFEIAGHSLGGGMASAASAVTGARATTFNAAGLHPDTPARFAKENGLPTFNPQQTVHTYQTAGEVLNDAQNGMQRLSEEQRRGYGVLANEVGMLLKEPAMQKLVGDKLREMMPPGAQTTAAQFVERLATTSGQEALRNFPVAAGRQELVLEPKMWDAKHENIVNRPKVAAPSQVAELAGPISEVAHSIGYGARGGRLVGEQLARAGAAGAHVLDRVGDGAEKVLRTEGMLIGQVVEMGSTTMQVSVRSTSTMMAQGRELLGRIDASMHRVEAAAQSAPYSAFSRAAGTLGFDGLADRLSSAAERASETGAQRAQHATRQAHSDADAIRAGGERRAASIDHNGQWAAGKLQNGFATAGAYADRGYDFAGAQVKGITSHAPAVLAAHGAVAAGVVTAAKTHVPVGPPAVAARNASNLEQTRELYERLGASFGEATARHGMAETVIPSLDAELAKQEAAARQLVEQHQRIQHPNDGRQASLVSEPTSLVVGINDPSHPDFKLFKGAQAGVHALDVAHNLTPDLRSDQLAGALVCKAKQGGLESIEHVVLSTDRTRVFAVDTEDTTSVHRKLAQVDIAQGREQPLSVSTEQVAEVNRQQLAQATPDKQPSQDLEAAQRDQEQQAAARRMG
ncbi:XVIPCD domain-containing protein [Stenotrophomonas sp. PS02289]|uniref:XVIPCD domain-containing protein n=1 Tax=Stenotrophomonas sp. PS02289 TaxID=2991422 RepID=UPI00249A6E95|nr:XVIPCD domain-containing protein [Stenotrophomonas sp. PS02289]